MNRDQLDYIKVKASVTARQLNEMFVGQPVYTDEKYDRMVQQANNRNIWVYASVRAIARSAASIPLVVYQKDSKGELSEAKNHPLQLLLDRPNEEQSANDFMESWVAFLMLAGNAYVEMNGPSEKGPPKELWLWRPDRTTIIPGVEGIESLRYLVNGAEIDIPYERALHTKFFHPTNDYYGLTPLQVAMRTIDMDNSTTDWNTTLVQNYGAPGGILHAPTDANIPRPQLQRIQRTLRRMFGGKGNVGKTHLLEGGLTWQQMGLSPKDMDFIDSRKMTREEICAVFGVPPQLVGIQENSTYSNYAEARQSFYQDTVLPTLDKIVSTINQRVSPLYGQNIVVGYDKTQIEALQESSDAKYERLSKVKDTLTINERRQELGYEPVASGDVLLIPTNVARVDVNASPIDAPEPPDIEPDAPTEEEEPEVKAMTLLMKAQHELSLKSEADEFNSKVDRMAAEGAKLIEGRFKAEWSELDKVLNVHKETLELDTELSGVLEVGMMKVIDEQSSEWYNLMVAINTHAAASMYYWQTRKLKNSIAHLQVKFDEYTFNDITEYMQDFIQLSSAEQVTYISEWTRQEIRSILRTATTESLTIGAVAKRLKTTYFEDFSAHRAYRIARTEMMAAASYGKQQGVKTSDLPTNKRWMATQDGRTRESHVLTSGQTVDINDYYNVNGYQAMHPGDPDLPAGERIHCRCVEVYEVRLDEV